MNNSMTKSNVTECSKNTKETRNQTVILATGLHNLI